MKNEIDLFGQIEQVIQYYAQNNNNDQETIVSCLREIQDILGYIPKDTQGLMAQRLNVKPVMISTLIKRYPSLKEQPAKHDMVICCGPRCQARGANDVLQTAENTLNIKVGHTSNDGLFSLRTQNCMHRCKTAVNITIDQQKHDNVTTEAIKKMIRDHGKNR